MKGLLNKLCRNIYAISEKVKIRKKLDFYSTSDTKIFSNLIHTEIEISIIEKILIINVADKVSWYLLSLIE